MARLLIEPRAAAAQKRLKKLAATIEDSDPILEQIGDRLRKNTVQRFHKGVSPTGRPWKRSKASRKRGGRTLVRTGRLRDSIRAVVNRGQLQVGTDVWYAIIAQQGGQIDAQYKFKPTRGGGGGLRGLGDLPNLPSLIRKTRRAAFKSARPRKARNVRLPARRFLGVSKKDRADMTKIIKAALEEAAK